MNIATISTTKARANIASIIAKISSSGQSVVIGKHNNPEVVIVPYPHEFNPKFSEMTNINAYSRSFDFLKNEPEIYSARDLKKRYV